MFCAAGYGLLLAEALACVDVREIDIVGTASSGTIGECGMYRFPCWTAVTIVISR